MLHRKANKPNSGCLYVLMVGLIVITLYVFNLMIVDSIFSSSPFHADQRARQFVELVAPITLIFIEFWIFDFLSDMLDRRIT